LSPRLGSGFLQVKSLGLIDPSSTNLETAVVQNQEGSFRAWFRAAVATVKMQFIIVSVYENQIFTGRIDDRFLKGTVKAM